jgi:hypothetical protein
MTTDGQGPVTYGPPLPPSGVLPPAEAFGCDPGCGCGPCGDSCACTPTCGGCGHGLFGWLFDHGPWAHHDGCANPDGCCPGQGPSFWLSGEYLMWWLSSPKVPPLVTTGSPQAALPGALGQPGTAVLFGGGHLDEDTRSGARFRTGYWFDDEHLIGVDGSFFFLGQRAVNFTAGSTGAPVLARPFFNAVTNAEDAELVAFPGVVAGVVNVNMTSRLWGFDADLRTNLCRGCWYNIDLLGGFRFLGLDDKLSISENLVTAGVPPVGFLVNDTFQTSNRFWGGQLGLDAEARWGRWSLQSLTKVALGNVREVVDINGGTVVNNPAVGRSVFETGGLLALPTNIGHYSQNRFAVLPEESLILGYQVTDWLRLTLGYNFLYLSDVIRPGQQIDRVVNVSQLPPGTLTGAPRPAFSFRENDFWVHGVSFGMEFRY